MRRTGIRIVVMVLIVSVCVFGTMTAMTEQADAKTKPKLSKKSVLIAKGGSQKITVKGGKGKWSIKNNGIAKISKKNKKSATITPIKPGSTVLTCKVKGKKLRCKVRVLNKSVGSIEDLSYRNNNHLSMIVGETWEQGYTDDISFKLDRFEYDSKKAKLTSSITQDANTGKTRVKVKIKALKPGHFDANIKYSSEGVQEYDRLGTFTIINGFRGKAKVKKTNKNYRAWRKKTITSMANSNMTTWQMVDAIGYLISTGKYSSKGGATGKQLWYGGNGTCVSGAKMMNDFMKDLGIKSKIHFMGKSKGKRDIHGYTIMYASQHKNTWIKIGGKTYELNPQPGVGWPIGVIRR